MTLQITATEQTALLGVVCELTTEQRRKLEAIVTWPHWGTIQKVANKEYRVSAKKFWDTLPEYQKYLAFIVLGYQGMGMFSRAVDVLWHSHQLYTQLYVDAFCMPIFGYVVYHKPNLDKKKTTARKKVVASDCEPSSDCTTYEGYCCAEGQRSAVLENCKQYCEECSYCENKQARRTLTSSPQCGDCIQLCNTCSSPVTLAATVTALALTETCDTYECTSCANDCKVEPTRALLSAKDVAANPALYFKLAYFASYGTMPPAVWGMKNPDGFCIVEAKKCAHDCECDSKRSKCMACNSCDTRCGACRGPKQLPLPLMSAVCKTSGNACSATCNTKCGYRGDKRQQVASVMRLPIIAGRCGSCVDCKSLSIQPVQRAETYCFPCKVACKSAKAVQQPSLTCVNCKKECTHDDDYRTNPALFKFSRFSVREEEKYNGQCLTCEKCDIQGGRAPTLPIAFVRLLLRLTSSPETCLVECKKDCNSCRYETECHGCNTAISRLPVLVAASCPKSHCGHCNCRSHCASAHCD